MSKNTRGDHLAANNPREAIRRLRVKQKELRKDIQHLVRDKAALQAQLDDHDENSFECVRCRVTTYARPNQLIDDNPDAPVCSGCVANAELLGTVRIRDQELARAREKITLSGGSKTHTLITALIGFVEATLSDPRIPHEVRSSLLVKGGEALNTYREALTGRKPKGQLIVVGDTSRDPDKPDLTPAPEPAPLSPEMAEMFDAMRSSRKET